MALAIGRMSAAKPACQADKAMCERANTLRRELN
jgi:hypothetical protein